MSRTRWLGVAAAALLATALLPGSASAADPTDGTVSGHLLDGATPVANANVFVEATDFSFFASATTDPSGAFSVGGLPPSDYRVQFSLPTGPSQYYHQTLAFEQAQIVPVAAGATVNLDEQVVPHGAIAGTVTTSAGQPATGANVQARRVDDSVNLQTFTDQAGHYTLPYAPPGSYTITFSQGGLSQAYHQRVGSAAPDSFAVALGATTTIDEQFLASGAVTGRLTDDGAPVAGATVVLENGSPVPPPFAFTDANGDFRLSAFPGRYTVVFHLPSGLTQYHPGQISFAQAQPVTVAAGADTIVNESVVPTGTLRGRLTNDGVPVAGAGVNADGNSGQVSAGTDADGRWQVQAFLGTYRIFFLTPIGIQWAHGKTSAATADPIALTSDRQVVTVDDALAPTGSLTVRARNKATGAPVTSFCATGSAIDFRCTEDGAIVYDVLPGAIAVFVSPTSADLLSGQSTATVVSGQSTSVVVDLTPAARITTTVRDSRTGAPVANICVEAIPTDGPSNLGNTNGDANCSDASGAVTVGSLLPGRYNVFAWARDNVHGHQWVGPHGGVGAQADARTVTVATGATVAIPPVAMDGRGTLTGVVTDKRTGTPIFGAYVGIATFNGNLGPTNAQRTTDPQGRYTFSELGPYQWSVVTRADGYAPEWSGHTPNRLKAKGIPVRANKTRVFNVALGQGVTLTGLVTTAAGVPVPQFAASLTAISAPSQDEMTVASTDTTGRYTLQLLGDQKVRILVSAFVDGQEFLFVANNGNAVTIPKRGPTTFNITLPN